MADIGKSITIRGNVTGEEDLIVDGRVEGRVELTSHHLTVGPNARVKADLLARELTINGRVVGNVVATERAEIQQSGRIEGDVTAPKLSIQDGAQLNGKVTTGAVPAGEPTKGKAKSPGSTDRTS